MHSVCCTPFVCAKTGVKNLFKSTVILTASIILEWSIVDIHRLYFCVVCALGLSESALLSIIDSTEYPYRYIFEMKFQIIMKEVCYITVKNK